jgi:hypothetical protein
LGKVRFAFCVHNHQPLGNFDWVIEDSYRLAYLPFLETLEKHPRFRAGIHNTGFLLDWLDEHHPEYVERLRALVDRDQVEILTGAYYEPILIAIPQPDRIAQINRLTEACEARFGARGDRPLGMWLAERVWEPALPPSLAHAGVGYTMLDEVHFSKTPGFRAGEGGHYLTEDQGASVAIVPIDDFLRHAIPFDPPRKVIEFLLDRAGETDDVLYTFADDGEKLGSWPGTHEWVYEKGWMDELIELAADNADAIEMALPGEYLAAHAARGLVYLPPCSYSEMNGWSGGNWRNFLVRYPEANWLHKRVMAVSGALARKRDAAEAVDHIHRAETNDAYWHGVFGGIYLPHLRRELYRNLAAAESAVRKKGASHIRRDVDSDGREEIGLFSDSLTVYFRPANGGAATEVGCTAAGVNVADCVARRREPYHDKIEKKTGRPLPTDWYSRGWFIDHFLRRDADLAGFARCEYPEQGDFVLGAYQAKVGRGRIEMTREGGVWVEAEFVPVRVTKTVRIDGDRLVCRYRIVNLSEVSAPLRFGSELSLGASSRAHDAVRLLVDGKALAAGTSGEKGPLTQGALEDGLAGWRARVEFDRADRLWWFPLETYSQSESGFDALYQATVIMPTWDFTLDPGETWDGSIAMAVVADARPAPSCDAAETRRGK